MRTISLFENERTTLEDAINLSLASLTEYGQRYRHWAVAYSGGKDSTATVAFVSWAIHMGHVPAPESLTVLYADTRMELPPLQQAAIRLLDTLRAEGYNAQVALPKMADRFFVYMLGRGVPPPSNTFRWCTPRIKIEPMMAALETVRGQAGEKFLMLTGLRLGESAARDAKIKLACSKDNAECGQGWLHIENATKEDKETPGMWIVSPADAPADTLAPLLEWRLCHVYDWLYFENERHGYDTTAIATVYGEEEIRTGCVGCNLTSRDTALERLIHVPEWSHLAPLLELKPLYAELKQAKHRRRKIAVEYRRDGTPARNVNRLGPLTMQARAYGLERINDIQSRAGVDLINAEEEAAIRQMWADNVWPNKWTGDDEDDNEATGDTAFDAYTVSADGSIAVQPLLVR